MRKTVLVVGAVIGAVLFLLGLLALIGALSGPPPQGSSQADEITAVLSLLIPGGILLGACLFFLARSAGGRAIGSESEQAYLEWYGWCSREFGTAGAVALHAATMAALTHASEGADGAARAARQVAAGAAAPPVSGSVKRSRAKLLARGGSATLSALEPGERALVMVFGTSLMKTHVWTAMFGIVGQLIAATGESAFYVTVTDRRVIAFNAAQLGGRVLSFAFAEPRSMVTAAYSKGALGRGSFTLTRLGGGRLRMQIAGAWTNEALAAIELLAPGLTQLPATPPVSTPF